MKEKKVEMREEDVWSLLQRYQAATILNLLKELAHHPDHHLDWHSLLHSSTASASASASAPTSASASGIKSPRELQLLWRHLAYRRPLDDDGLDEDDESDLDIELEAYPTPTTEAAIEAAACVKVLAGPPFDTANNNTNTITNTNTNTTQPVVEAADPQPQQLKKRKWTAEEDDELRKAVDKWGEGNWSSISKHVNFSRTATQLSQRWSHIRKKQHSSSSSATPHLSEAQLATRRAIDLALKDPSPAPPKPKLMPMPNPSSKLPLTVRPPPLKKPPSISDTIQRTAVAAGARIVSPSDADAGALRNCANVRFFRTTTTVSLPTNPKAPQHLPLKREIPVLAKLPSDAAEETLPRPSPRVGVELNQKKKADACRDKTLNK